MANKQPTDKTNKNVIKKRVVKNPETFRERAVKASEGSDKPKRLTVVRQAGTKVSSPITRPVGNAGKKVASVPPFRWLRKPLQIIGRILVPKYIRQSWNELRLVHWPDWKTARQLTFAVMIFAIVFGAVIATVDYGLDKLFRNILLK